MNRTTLTNRIGTRRMRRLTIIALTGSVLALTAAAPASAQTFGSDGYIYAAVDCNLTTKTANVSVSVMEPRYTVSGLVFYTQVFAKAHSAKLYNFIGDGQTPVIRTWSQYNSDPFGSNRLDWEGGPARIFDTAFTGSIETTYDIYVKYWYRLPTSSTWAGPYGFTVPGDPHSTVTLTTSYGGGHWTRSSGTCNL